MLLPTSSECDWISVLKRKITLMVSYGLLVYIGFLSLHYNTTCMFV